VSNGPATVGFRRQHAPWIHLAVIAMQRLAFHRSLPAIILIFAIQSCVNVGPGPAPPANPPFDTYNSCIQKDKNILLAAALGGEATDASRQECFRQTIQTNHLSLPAGTTPEQAYSKYKACMTENAPLAVTVGPFVLNGNKQDTARQNCFTSALQ
jgi:hypothetical protein